MSPTRGETSDGHDCPPPLGWLEWLHGLAIAVLGGMAWAGLAALQFGRLPVVFLVGLGLLLGLAYSLVTWRVGWRPRPGSGPGPWALGSAPLILVALALWRIYPGAAPWAAYLDSGWYLNAGHRIAREERLSFFVPLLAVEEGNQGPGQGPLPPRAAGQSDRAGGPNEAGAANASTSPAPESARRAHPLVSTLADGRQAGLPFRDDDRRGFHAVAFAVPDAERPIAVPYHPPFFSSWIALWLRGLPAFAGASAGNAVLPWSLLYLTAAGALATAAFGPAVGVFSMAMLLLGPAYAYYGSTPYAEMMGGSLALTGLWLLTRAACGPPSVPLAAAAGLALGLAALAKPELAITLLVAGLWWLAVRRGQANWREGAALLLGALLPLLHATWLALTVSRFYFVVNGGGVLSGLLDHPERKLLGLVAVTALAWTSMRPRCACGRAPLAFERARRWLGIGVLAIVAGSLVQDQLASRAAVPSMLVILAWLMTPLGFWAAAVAFTLGLERGGTRSRLLLGIAAAVTPLWLLAPLVAMGFSPLYAARRLVPLVLPVLTVLAAWLGAEAVRLWPRPVTRWLSAGGAAVVLAGLVMASQPLAGWREWSGTSYMARRLASYSGPDDVVLFVSTLGRAEAGRMAAAVWNLGDRPVAVIGSPWVDSAALEALIGRWRSNGRDVFLVSDRTDELPTLVEHELTLVGEESLVTRVLSPVPRLPVQSATQELRFDIYQVLPCPAAGCR